MKFVIIYTRCEDAVNLFVVSDISSRATPLPFADTEPDADAEKIKNGQQLN